MDKKKNYVMGIDFGTQSLNLGIYDILGNSIMMVSKGYKTYYLKGGLVEQRPDDWWNALKYCMEKAKQTVDLSKVKSIAVCATSSTVLLTDQQLHPITNAISWMDKRNIEEEELINNNEDPLVQNVLKYSGNKVSIEWMIAKALWFKNNYDITDKRIVEQLDWINYKLTGRLVASQCNATCKWSYIESRGGFNESFLEKVGLGSILEAWPEEVLKVGEQIGVITEKASKELGVMENTPVFQGGIDAHIGMIGSGSLEYGNLSLITGTSFVHLVHHDRPVFNEGLWGPYDSPLLDDKWLIEGGQLSAGSIISWFMREFYESKANDLSVFDDLNEEIKNIDIGCEGLLTLDNWQGNRSPYRDPYAKGAFIGLTPAHTKFHMYRSILESIALGTTNVIKAISSLNIDISRIIAGGGLTKNKLLMQMISDCSNKPIYLVNDRETSTKGAAIIAAFGIEAYLTINEASQKMTHISLAYKPNEENHRKFQNLFQKYIELNSIMNPFTRNMMKEG